MVGYTATAAAKKVVYLFKRWPNRQGGERCRSDETRHVIGMATGKGKGCN
jgi:hypothetical protein